MIEEALLQYGILGLWTATLLGERYVWNRDMKDTISRNTQALGRIEGVMRECQKYN